MKKMNEQMARLYQAAKKAGCLSSNVDQSGMARLLNVAPQNVNNWESRGPSKEALLEAQASFKVNATWVMTGQGPMFVGSSDTNDMRLEEEIAPFVISPPPSEPSFLPRVDRHKFGQLSQSQRDGIEDWVIEQIERYTEPASPKSPAGKPKAA